MIASSDPPDPMPTFETDVATIGSSLSRLIDKEGKDVVVVMHSYGGAPGTEAATPFAKHVRSAQGLQGGIVRLAYMAALVPLAGEAAGQVDARNSATDAESGFHKQRANFGTFAANGTILPNAEAVVARFYSDLDAPTAREYAGHLHPHSALAFRGKVTVPGYTQIPASYLVTRDDQAVGHVSQRRMAKEAGIDDVVEIDAGHAPFLSKVNETVDWIRRVAEKSSQTALRKT